MAWETRQRGGRYYYQSIRRPDGSIRRVYVGIGPTAERIAAQDRNAQEERQRVRKQVRELESVFATAARVVQELESRCDLILAAALLANGFHKHRGEWRLCKDDRKPKEA